MDELDLTQLFGTYSIKYLEQICSIKMLIYQMNGKNKGYIFITSTEHVLVELINLSGLEFNGKNIIISLNHFKQPQVALKFILIFRNIFP